MALSDMHDQPDHEPKPFVAVISPAKAQAFSLCAYRFAHDKKPFDVGGRQQQLGKWVHELIHQDNVARISGRELPVDEVVFGQMPPAILLDNPDAQEWTIRIGRESLYGYRAFLEEHEFAAILDAERYVRIPARPVIGVRNARIIFSGRFDVAALGHDRSVACVDIKTGALYRQQRLMEAPSSFIYHHLTDYLYASEGIDHMCEAIDIVQVNPLTGQWVSVRLTVEQIEAGKAFCRRMVAALREGEYSPSPGDQCTYCALASECPAHQTLHPGWDTDF